MKEKQRKTPLIFPFSLLFKIQEWIHAGDPIPQTHRKGIWETIALDFFGIIALLMPILSYFEYIGPKAYENKIGLLIAAAIALIPGIYATVCTIACWRRVPGFSWGMIPYFD